MSEAILTNYHTHTARCHHAGGTEEDYIRTAIRCGFRTLGFADHAPWAYATPGFVSRIRMLPEELEGYVRTLRRLRAQYSGEIRLRIGLEAEYYPAYMDWLLAEKKALGIEYLIFGCHFDLTDETGIYFGRSTLPMQVRLYADRVVAGLETGAYCCLAHPDLYLNRYPALDEAAAETAHRICEAAARLNVPLEYNLAGLDQQKALAAAHAVGQGYTTEFFWKIAAQYPIKAIIGCDAHEPDELDRAGQIAQARADLQKLGIEVLDALPGLN